MEIKYSKVFFNKGGAGGYTSRVTIPGSWLKQLNINIDSNEIQLKFDGEKIIIEKK